MRSVAKVGQLNTARFKFAQGRLWSRNCSNADHQLIKSAIELPMPQGGSMSPSLPAFYDAPSDSA